ncbi:MAG: HTH-type transcriptional regulator UlaR [Psittacicella sp.]
MKQTLRHSQILKLLQIEEYLTVQDLENKLGISQSTVRRDLKILSEKGLLERLYNGARLATSSSKTSNLWDLDSQNVNNNNEMKISIAKAASLLLKPEESVMLSQGSTIFRLAKEICGLNLQILSNSFPLIHYLIENNHKNIIVLGGQYDQNNEYTVPFGHINYSNYSAHYMFTTGSSLTKNGLYKTGNLSMLAENQMVDRVSKIVVLVDSSKVGLSIGMHFLPPKDIDIIITGKDADKNIINSLRKQGIEIILV